MSKRIPMIMAALMLVTIFGDLSFGQLRLPFRSNQKQEEHSVEQTQGLILNERCGPWLIMCASFSGDAGERKAENLAEELRRKHGMKAYVYRHKFDHTDHFGQKCDPDLVH